MTQGSRAARQQGFAAIAAIFLVVILAALGAFMVSVSNTQQVTSAQDLQGSRAYWAAQAGLEWGIATTTTKDSLNGCTDFSATPPTTLSLNGFTVVIKCTAAEYTDGVKITIFNINSIASFGATGSVGAIERSVSASVCRNTNQPYAFCGTRVD